MRVFSNKTQNQKKKKNQLKSGGIGSGKKTAKRTN